MTSFTSDGNISVAKFARLSSTLVHYIRIGYMQQQPPIDTLTPIATQVRQKVNVSLKEYSLVQKTSNYDVYKHSRSDQTVKLHKDGTMEYRLGNGEIGRPIHQGPAIFSTKEIQYHHPNARNVSDGPDVIHFTPDGKHIVQTLRLDRKSSTFVQTPFLFTANNPPISHAVVDLSLRSARQRFQHVLPTTRISSL